MLFQENLKAGELYDDPHVRNPEIFSGFLVMQSVPQELHFQLSPFFAYFVPL